MFWFLYFIFALLAIDVVKEIIQFGSPTTRTLILFFITSIGFLFPLKKHYIPFLRNGKRLRQEKWYRDLLNRYGIEFIFNVEIRKLIKSRDIEFMLSDPYRNEALKEEFHQVISKEKL